MGNASFALRSIVSALALAAPLASGCAADFSDLVPPTVDEDPSLPAEEINGTRLHLTTRGDPAAPVVIILHGGPGSDHRAMLPFGDLADDGFFVVLWDQRGTGLSRRHRCDDVGAKEYLGDLEAIVERYAPPGHPVFLLGHSWGAMYATWFINEHPDRVSSAVLIEPGGFTSAQVDEYFQRLVTYDVLGEDMNDALYAGRFLTPDDHARADLLAAALFTAVDGPFGKDTAHPEPFWRAGGIAAKCLPASVGDFDWTTNLRKFPSEVLFVRGDRNRILSEAHQNALAAYYASARVVTLAGVGHDLYWLRHEQIRALALDHFHAWLARGK